MGPVVSTIVSIYPWYDDLWIDSAMTTITISPKFQVVIPKAIRELLGLEPGQKLQAIAFADRIELVLVKKPKQLRGFLRGIDTSIEREPDRS